MSTRKLCFIERTDYSKHSIPAERYLQNHEMEKRDVYEPLEIINLRNTIKKLYKFRC